MKAILRTMFFSTVSLAIFIPAVRAAEPPHIKMENGAGQLIVNGRPFLILGGELRNSSAQAAGTTHALVLHAGGLRPTQTVALGGYLFEATLSRTWPAGTLATDDGAMLVLQASSDEFYILGSGLTVSISRDPDVDAAIAGIASVEEVSRTAGKWAIEKRLNGDQTNQGRQLLMDPHHASIYRVRLYSIGSEPGH